MDPAYTVHPLVNWYFMVASTGVVTLLGWFVTARIVEPKLGPWDPSRASDDLGPARLEALTDAERRGLRRAGAAALATAALIAWTVVPADGILRNPATGSVLHSPFRNGVVCFIFVMFLVPGFVYGRAVGTLRNDRDVIKAMEGGMRALGLYIVLVFFAAQFVAWFGWSNIGTIMAVLGARGLEAAGLTGPVFFLLFIPFCAFINLAIGSASAKWAIMAPIFVPMLVLLGYSPELTQTAYRIGDSVSNVITPMMSYFGLILAFAGRYVRDLGIDALIATMLPYTLVFLAGWTVFFYLYVFVLGLPLGPATTYYWPAS
jgi:aminobenzoyl-glutamate transport protein